MSSWAKYSKDIEDIIELFFRKVKNGGKVIMTFNNLDPRAWKIVLESFSKFSFLCREAKYQVPAVVSSKAQMASNTSYLGDYYCVFEKQSKPIQRGGDLFYLTEKLKQVLFSRDGKAPVNLVNQVAILTVLNENLTIDLIEKIDDAVKPIANRVGDYFELRDGVDLSDRNPYRLEEILKSIAAQELSKDKKSIKDFYEVILAKTDLIGSPPISEIKSALKGTVLFEGDYCYLQNVKSSPQSSLF